MNRELYIHTLSQFRDECKRKHMDTETEAFNAAIQALSADGDCISRQAAIEVIDAVFPVDPMKSEYAQGIACGAALAKTYVEQLPSAQPEPQWIPCSECMYWRDERVLMNDGKARQYNGDEPDALGIKHSVSIDVGINQGAMCLYEEGRGWSTDHTTFRNADDFCSRAKKRPCSYEEWYGIVDGVYAEPWRGEEP